MNISENLQRILTDKQNIANAINAKGVSCQFSESLDTYADKISRISGGGGGETEREIILSNGDSFDFNFKIKLKDLYQKTTFQFYGEVDDPVNPGEGFTVTFNIDFQWYDFSSGIYIVVHGPYENQVDIQCDGEWFYFTNTSGESFELITIQINLPIYYI